MTHFLRQHTVDDKKLYDKIAQQERLIIKTSEMIWVEAKNQEKTLERLAKAIGKTKGYLSQLLGGDRNMTLRTLSDLAYSLDMEVQVSLTPNIEKRGWKTAEKLEAFTGDIEKPRKQIYSLDEHPEYRKVG